MNHIDLTPLYRSSIGFDRFQSLFDSAFSDKNATTYPPYNIEVVEENQYTITLAVAGFSRDELDLEVENGVLTVRGKKSDAQAKHFLHQGIATRSFERRFNLVDYIEVKSADLRDGLLEIHLLKEVPEAMKPKSIAINSDTSRVLNHGEAVKAA